MWKTFYNDKREKWQEKCPDCNEEFLNWKGGAQCLYNHCQEKQLEETHRQAAKPMVDHCLVPKGIKGVQVDCPNDSIMEVENAWGWTNDIANQITIPWYTLRSKKRFFNNVAHESGHILAYQKKFIVREERKVLEKWNQKIEEYVAVDNEYRKLSLWDKYKPEVREYYFKKAREKENQIKLYKDKHKRIIATYENASRKGKIRKWGYGERYFYPSYVECFNSLINSSYSKYNYNNSSRPKPFEEVRDYGKGYSKI